MGRSPCCLKVGLKKGPWTPEEDRKLLAYVQEHGHGSWRALPLKAGLQRCGKSCRLRWINYLRPDIKRGKFSLQEDQTIIQLHALLGNRWSAIATHLSKRTDNEIKNYWNTHLKKRLIKMGIDPVSHKPKNDTLLSNDGCLKRTANLSHMAQWESARLEAEARLVKQSKICSMNSTACSMASASGPPAYLSSIHTSWSSGINGNTSGDSESSASMLSATRFYELLLGGSNESVLEEVEECRDHKNGIEGFDRLAMDNDEPVAPNGDFLEHFTDLLRCSSDRCSFTGEENSMMDLVCSDRFDDPIENVNDCYQDEKQELLGDYS